MKDQEGTMDFDQVTSLSLSQNAFDYRYVSGYCTLKMPQATSLPWITILNLFPLLMTCAIGFLLCLLTKNMSVR